jgi:hypothetical protein
MAEASSARRGPAPALDSFTFMNAIFKDYELIERARLAGELKVCAQEAACMLHHLRALSAKLGIPLEQMTVEHIIQEYSGWDAKGREYQERFGWWFDGKPPRKT